jgi:hypothetical protein
MAKKPRKRPAPPAPKVDPTSAEAWRQDPKCYAPLDGAGRRVPTYSE